ncbi:MAG: outer membrane protein assembly factor BamB, partial [Verrucomicrobiales bacterium]
MKIRRPLILLFILLASAISIRAADWPTYRADHLRSGDTPESIPNQLTLRWVHRLEAPRPAWPTSIRIDFDLAFQPIIMGDLVLFGSSADDQVRAIDAATGEIRWRFFTGAPIRFAPAGWEDRVFVASDDGFLYAIRLSDGELLWKFRGGPDDSMVLGNDRMISKWPARGGPVVRDGVVYFTAGVWPSDGVHLHSLDAQTGKPIWSNSETGQIFMAQPHGGANAESGVSAQGYLVAADQQLLVPTGRAVPAAFDLEKGNLLYYHLQKNQQRGGTRAMSADRFFINAGCLFDRETGDLAGQIGHGPSVSTGDNVVQSMGKSLKVSRWVDAKVVDRKGQSNQVRQLQETRLVSVEAEILDFIVAGGDAICGEDGRVAAVDFSRQRTRWWSHEVEGKALGLAAGNGKLVVSTDAGLVYCFDGEPGKTQEFGIEASAEVPSPKLAAAAEEILEQTGVLAGFCVDLEAGTGDLAIALARKSDLQIYAVESDPDKVKIARQRIAAAGLYGNRIVVHQAEPGAISYPKYFANLVVSSKSLTETPSPAAKAEMHRIQRPFGGKICLGPVGEMEIDERGPLEGGGSWT